MLFHIVRQLRIADPARVDHLVWRNGHRGDLDRVVLVPVDPPQLCIGHIDIAREILRQLDARDLLAIDRLDLREGIAITGRREKLLPFAKVELAVGLELGVARDFGWRRVARHVDDLFIARANAQALVLLLEQRILDHLVDDLVLDLLVFFARHRGIAVLLPILLRGDLDALLVFGNGEFLAVDLQHHVGITAKDSQHLTQSQPPNKRDGEDIEDPFCIGAHRAQHGDFKLR